MSKKDKNERGSSVEFDLTPPSKDRSQATDGTENEAGILHHSASDSKIHKSDPEAKFKVMGWKNIDEDEEEYEPEFGVKKEPIPEDEMDMTPMVDVTFLLLIFFMVTASFTLQTSLEQPPAQSDDPSTQVVDPEPEEDYIQVTIDQTNTYYVTTRDSDEEEAPSDRDMRFQVKDAKDNYPTASRLIIKAHVDSKHKKVITAWDVGVSVGMAKIEIQTFDEDY